MKANTDNDHQYTRISLLMLVMLAAFCATCVSAEVPAGWQTYRSRDYGFVIDLSQDVSDICRG